MSIKCPDCGQEFKGPQALGPHRRAKHSNLVSKPRGPYKKRGTAPVIPSPSRDLDLADVLKHGLCELTMGEQRYTLPFATLRELRESIGAFENGIRAQMRFVEETAVNPAPKSNGNGKAPKRTETLRQAQGDKPSEFVKQPRGKTGNVTILFVGFTDSAEKELCEKLVPIGINLTVGHGNCGSDKFAADGIVIGRWALPSWKENAKNFFRDERWAIVTNTDEAIAEAKLIAEHVRQPEGAPA